MNNLLQKIGIIGFGVFLANAALAWDFLYVEHTNESTRLVEITPLDLSGQGSITLEDDCDICPDLLPYNSDTLLTTPFGSGGDINELIQWQGHRAMIHYSTTDPTALRVVVYSATNVEEDL